MTGFNEYQDQALVTAKEDVDLLIMSALGIGGESGEYIELVKKHKFHHRPMPVESAKLELGDILWYVAVAARANGLTLQDVADSNIEKLRIRHGGTSAK